MVCGSAPRFRPRPERPWRFLGFTFQFKRSSANHDAHLRFALYASIHQPAPRSRPMKPRTKWRQPAIRYIHLSSTYHSFLLEAFNPRISKKQHEGENLPCSRHHYFGIGDSSPSDWHYCQARPVSFMQYAIELPSRKRLTFVQGALQMPEYGWE